MARKIKYQKLPYQSQFHDSIKPKVYLSTGYGGGKTYSLAMKCFKLMNLNKGLAGGILCPTLKMYKKDVVPTITEICRENRIPYSYNKSDGVWYFPDVDVTVHAFHSEDEGKSIRGPNLAWGVINEVTLCSREAFLAFMARIRLQKAKLLQLAVSGTPEGFNWAYEYFVENPREDTDFITGDMRLNTHVAESYAKTLQESYDPLMQEQYIEGKFVNLTGKRCAYAFDRRKHTDPNIEKFPTYPVWVSMDFNVTPMSATLWNRVPFGYVRGAETTFNHELRAFDEISLDCSNTDELCEVLRSKLSADDDVTIYPDPAGAARSTKSRGLSDIDILRNHGFKSIKYKPITSVRNCLNALNGMLSRDRIILNSRRCKNTIADLEQCHFKDGSFEIDKSNLRRSHWLDGAKNMIEYEFPIHRPGGFREERIW